MSDIVEELRIAATGDTVDPVLMRDAADVIESLVRQLHCYDKFAWVRDRWV